MTTEKEIASFTTGLALGNDFFAQQEKMTQEDWMPVIHSLITQCDGLIKSPGIYSITLHVSKIK
jgi:hypothetical protein